MTAAVLPRPSLVQRLLVLHAGDDVVFDEQFSDLPRWFEPGDVLVVNDAATLPASLPMQVHGVLGELRLVGAPEDGWVVLFGPGSWREATEYRVAPPRVAVGDVVGAGAELGWSGGVAPVPVRGCVPGIRSR